jgi:hypothetical protein
MKSYSLINRPFPLNLLEVTQKQMEPQYKL